MYKLSHYCCQSQNIVFPLNIYALSANKHSKQLEKKIKKKERERDEIELCYSGNYNKTISHAWLGILPNMTQQMIQIYRYEIITEYSDSAKFVQFNIKSSQTIVSTRFNSTVNTSPFLSHWRIYHVIDLYICYSTRKNWDWCKYIGFQRYGDLRCLLQCKTFFSCSLLYNNSNWKWLFFR